jgi:hypothetical protein
VRRTHDKRQSRRRFLGAITGTTALLAGCSGSDSASNDSSGTQTTQTRTTTGGSNGTNTATSTETNTTAETQTSATPAGGGEGNLEVLESELSIDEGQYTTDIAMTGLLENTGSGTLRVPEIGVRFYNDSDSVLDSTSESIAFLKPGDRWDVRSSYLQEEAPATGEISITSTEVFQTELGLPDPLELTEENLETGTDPTIEATIENTSQDSLDVSAFAVFYADETIALGDGLDSLSGLAGGESWSVTLESLITPEERAERVSDYALYANVL